MTMQTNNSTSFVWDESMSTGVARLDEQHRQLIDKFNEFSAIIDSQKNADMRVAAGQVLDYLQFYVAWHFQQEEELMEKYHCEVTDNNKHGHVEFAAEFKKLYTNWQKGTMDLETVRKTHLRLANWIMWHIKEIDTQLRPYVEAAGESDV